MLVSSVTLFRQTVYLHDAQQSCAVPSVTQDRFCASNKSVKSFFLQLPAYLLMAGGSGGLISLALPDAAKSQPLPTLGIHQKVMVETLKSVQNVPFEKAQDELAVVKTWPQKGSGFVAATGMVLAAGTTTMAGIQNSNMLTTMGGAGETVSAPFVIAAPSSVSKGLYMLFVGMAVLGVNTVLGGKKKGKQPSEPVLETLPNPSPRRMAQKIQSMMGTAGGGLLVLGGGFLVAGLRTATTCMALGNGMASLMWLQEGLKNPWRLKTTQQKALLAGIPLLILGSAIYDTPAGVPLQNMGVGSIVLMLAHMALKQREKR